MPPEDSGARSVFLAAPATLLHRYFHFVFSTNIDTSCIVPRSIWERGSDSATSALAMLGGPFEAQGNAPVLLISCGLALEPHRGLRGPILPIASSGKINLDSLLRKWRAAVENRASVLGLVLVESEAIALAEKLEIGSPVLLSEQEVLDSLRGDLAGPRLFFVPDNSSIHQLANRIGIRAGDRVQRLRRVMTWGSLIVGAFATMAVLAVLGLRHLDARRSAANAVRVHDLCAKAAGELDMEAPATYQKARDGLRAALSDQEQLACYNELLVDTQADVAHVVFAIAGLWARAPRSRFPLMLESLIRATDAWVSTDSLEVVVSAFAVRHSKREDAIAFWARRMRGAVAKPGGSSGASSKRNTDKDHQIATALAKPPPGAFDESANPLSVEEGKTRRRLALLDDWISDLPTVRAARMEWKPPWLTGDTDRNWISWKWQEILGTWGWLGSCSKVAVEPLPGRATSRAIRSWMAEYLGYKDAWMLPRRPEPCPWNPEFESCRVKYEPKGREFTCEKTGFGEPICLPVHGEEGVCVSPI
jgi:hypothetical protein